MNIKVEVESTNIRQYLTSTRLYYSNYGNMLPQRGMEVDRRAPNPSQGRLHVGQDG